MMGWKPLTAAMLRKQEEDYYKANRHLMMADVVNPHNIFEFYGKETRIVRWLKYHETGFVRTHILPFPPLKEGEPESEQAKEACKRIRKDTERYWQWRESEKLRCPGYSRFMERNARADAQKAKEEAERKMMMINEAKAPKTKIRKKMMAIKARNLPNRSFHLFKTLLNKNKKRISRMKREKGRRR